MLMVLNYELVIHAKHLQVSNHELWILVRPSEIDKDCRVHIWPGIGSLARWKIRYLDI